MLPAIRRNPTGVFMNAARRFGDVVYFKIGPRRGYLITSPATFDMVFGINARNYRRVCSTTSFERCSATAS
jgi:hypothetical protein